MTARRTGHIRARSKDSWEIRYSLGTDPSTGKRRIATATIHGNRKDAERELRHRLQSLDKGEHVDPTRITLNQWLKMWLEAVRVEVSPKTHERYEDIVKGLLVPELGNLQLSKLVPAHIQAAYNKWAKEGRRDGKKGALSPRTRRHIHRILRSALSRAVDQQVIHRNPTDSFRNRLPRIERREMITLTVQQSAQLLGEIRHTRIYWPTLLALAVGLRRGEILALRWRNVDLERGVLRVVESLEQTKSLGLRFKSTKSEKPRAVTIPFFAVMELRRLKHEQAQELLKLGVCQDGETLVYGRTDGEPLQPRSLTHEFTRLIKRRSNLPRVRFHDLRHSHATQLVLDGVHPKIAQERLGHSTITTTLDLYSHVTDTMQTDAAERLDASLGSAVRKSLAG
jgi:integrase